MKIKLDYKNGIVEIDQKDKVDNLLRAFGMENCNKSNSPMPSWGVPSKDDIPEDEGEIKRLNDSFDMYGAVGHMNYLQCISRPEISFPLKILSANVLRFGEKHIELAKHVMRWLKGTSCTPLIIRKGGPRVIQIFTDASHAADTSTRKSITGVVIKIGGNTVFWCAIFQRIVSHSSCESELMALDKGATVGQYVKWVHELMGGPAQGAINIFVDNQSTIDISTNPIQPGRNLHVHARYFYIRDLVEAKVYDIMHLRSSDQIADILCTYKGVPNFSRLFALIMGCARVRKDKQGELSWDTTLLL
jgi:hypothetical protein